MVAVQGNVGIESRAGKPFRPTDWRGWLHPPSPVSANVRGVCDGALAAQGAHVMCMAHRQYCVTKSTRFEAAAEATGHLSTGTMRNHPTPREVPES